MLFLMTTCKLCGITVDLYHVLDTTNAKFLAVVIIFRRHGDHSGYCTF